MVELALMEDQYQLEVAVAEVVLVLLEEMLQEELLVMVVQVHHQ